MLLPIITRSETKETKMTLVLLEKLIQPGTSIASHFAVFLNKTTIYVMMASVGSTARHWRPCGEKMMEKEEQQNFQRRLFQAELLLIGEIADMTGGLETTSDPAAAFTSDPWRVCRAGKERICSENFRVGSRM
jgi:hypothetical protein